MQSLSCAASIPLTSNINTLRAMPILKAVHVRPRAPLRRAGIAGPISLIAVEECLRLERDAYTHSFIRHVTRQVCFDFIMDL